MITHKDFFNISNDRGESVWDFVREKFPEYQSQKDLEKENAVYRWVRFYNLNEEQFKEVCRQIMRNPEIPSEKDIIYMTKAITGRSGGK